MAIHHAVARYLEFADEALTEELKAAMVAARKVAKLEPQEAETWAQLALATSLLGMVNHQHGLDHGATCDRPSASRACAQTKPGQAAVV